MFEEKRHISSIAKSRKNTQRDLDEKSHVNIRVATQKNEKFKINQTLSARRNCGDVTQVPRRLPSSSLECGVTNRAAFKRPTPWSRSKADGMTRLASPRSVLSLATLLLSIASCYRTLHTVCCAHLDGLRDAPTRCDSMFHQIDIQVPKRTREIWLNFYWNTSPR